MNTVTAIIYNTDEGSARGRNIVRVIIYDTDKGSARGMKTVIVIVAQIKSKSGILTCCEVSFLPKDHLLRMYLALYGSWCQDGVIKVIFSECIYLSTAVGVKLVAQRSSSQNVFISVLQLVSCWCPKDHLVRTFLSFYGSRLQVVVLKGIFSECIYLSTEVGVKLVLERSSSQNAFISARKLVSSWCPKDNLLRIYLFSVGRWV